MYESTPIDLGWIAQDQITGFKGVVTTVGAHLSGCTRIGMYRLGDVNNPPDSKGAEQFFHEGQLEIVEENTRWSHFEKMTSVDYDLGERGRDRATEFEGRVHIVNFKLFNCPQALVYEIGGGVDDSRWVDDPFVVPQGDHIETPAQSGSEQTTGASGSDTRTENLSKN